MSARATCSASSSCSCDTSPLSSAELRNTDFLKVATNVGFSLETVDQFAKGGCSVAMLLEFAMLLQAGKRIPPPLGHGPIARYCTKKPLVSRQNQRFERLNVKLSTRRMSRQASFVEVSDYSGSSRQLRYRCFSTFAGPAL